MSGSWYKELDTVYELMNAWYQVLDMWDMASETAYVVRKQEWREIGLIFGMELERQVLTFCNMDRYGKKSVRDCNENVTRLLRKPV